MSPSDARTLVDRVPARPEDRLVARIFRATVLGVARPPSPAAISLVALGLFACWLLVSGSLTEETFSRQWFYVPIALAAMRFGALGAAVAAGIATVLAGPAVPVAGGHDVQIWGVRGLLFYFVGIAVAAMAGAHRVAIQAEADAQRRETELEVERAELVQTVSHEFRTPLTIISAASKSLTRPALSDEQRDKLIDALQRGVTRLRNLIEVVLAAVETPPDQRLPSHTVDLQHLCDEVMQDLEHLDAKARTRTHVTPGLSVAFLPGATRMLCYTLVENALKFSPSTSPVDVSWTRSADHVELAVTDHGPGIPEDDLAEAFRPFTQLDQSSTRARGGLGMGLYTAKRLCERLGGSLRLDSSTEGTRAVIRIPQRRATDPIQQATAHTDDIAATTPAAAGRPQASSARPLEGRDLVGRAS